jgi:hypothetical protein
MCAGSLPKRLSSLRPVALSFSVTFTVCPAGIVMVNVATVTVFEWVLAAATPIRCPWRSFSTVVRVTWTLQLVPAVPWHARESVAWPFDPLTLPTWDAVAGAGFGGVYVTATELLDVSPAWSVAIAVIAFAPAFSGTVVVQAPSAATATDAPLTVSEESAPVSLAIPVTVTLGDVSVAPLTGEVIATVGGSSPAPRR